ncbi:MAG TPA: hypothetical protein PKE32_09500 [Miltoncostaeaceae bacterium]|nr:hypothetical protein [Miltoncostaeaceae bacterium]
MARRLRARRERVRVCVRAGAERVDAERWAGALRRALADGDDAVFAVTALRVRPGERGDGPALRRELLATGDDLVVWLVADGDTPDPARVAALLGPLLADEGVVHVVGAARGAPGDDDPLEEICARPLLALLYPALAGLARPLALEAAGRGGALRDAARCDGDPFEVGLLIDLLRAHGPAALAQVELPARAHGRGTRGSLAERATTLTRTVVGRLADDAIDGRDLPRLDHRAVGRAVGR